jgi:phage tail-like protein
MPRRDEPLLRTSHFAVLIGTREIGVAQIGPLTSLSDVEPERGAPVNRFVPVVLRRALTDSTELYDWRRRAEAGRDDRRDVTIRQLSAPGGEVVNTWRLVGAWPSRWSGPTFDALSGGIAFEELELTFDDLVWVDRAPPVR